MRDVLVISAAVVRSWGHGCVTAIGSRAAARAVGGAGVAALAAWVIFGYLAMRRGWSELEGMPADLVLPLVGAVVTLGASAAVVLVLVIAPERTALEAALRLLPIRPTSRVTGSVLPLLVVAALVAVASTGPALLVAARAVTHETGALVLTLGAFALHLTQTLLAASALYLLVRTLASQALRLRLAHAHVAAAVSVAAVSLLATAGALVPGGRTPPALRLTMAVAGSASAQASRPGLVLGYFALSAEAAAALGGLLLGVAAYAGRDPGTQVVALGRSMPWPRRRLSALVWVEVLGLLRSPSVLAVALLLALTPLGLAVASKVMPAVGTVTPILGPAILLGCSLITLHAYGLSRRHHWIYRSTVTEARAWVTPKWLGTAAVWFSLVVLVAVGLLLALDTPLAALTANTSSLLLAFAAAHLAGLLLPVSEEQPLSAAVTGLAGALLSGGSIFALHKVAAVVPNAVVPLVAAGFALLLYAAYRSVAVTVDAGRG